MTTPPAAGPTGAPPAPPPAAPPLLRTQDKVAAGVAGGVARRLGVDPTLVRVLLVVLALFGGVGVLLYALGWLLIPEESTGRSLLDRAVRGDADAQTVLLAVGLGLAVVLLGVGILRQTWLVTTMVVVLLVLGALFLTRTTPGRPQRSSMVPPPPATFPSDEPSSPTGGATRFPASVPAGYPYAAPAAGSPAFGEGADAPPEHEPRRRSVLGILTVSVAALAVGLLGLADALGASVPVSAYLALPLAVTGLGLVVGAWAGRARGLIALGAVLALALPVTAALERLDVPAQVSAAFEQTTVAPTDATLVDGRTFEHGAGDLVYDLTALDGGDAELAIRVGTGSLLVLVPADATVDLTVQVGAGQVEAFGESTSGLGVTYGETHAGRTGADTISLDIEMGLGDVEVTRAAA